MKPTIRTILLPTDFGPSAQSTAAYAGALARGLNVSVHLVHVLELGAGTRDGWSAASEDDGYHEARARLEALAATLQIPRDRITLEVRTGKPAEAIADAAVDYGADLIVMSTPPNTLVRVSVFDQVLRAALCPVLAVCRSGSARVHTGHVAA